MIRDEATDGLNVAIKALREARKKLEIVIGQKEADDMDYDEESYEVDNINARLMTLRKRKALLDNSNDNAILGAPSPSDIQSVKNYILTVQQLTLDIAMTQAGLKMIIDLAHQGIALGTDVEMKPA